MTESRALALSSARIFRRALCSARAGLSRRLPPLRAGALDVDHAVMALALPVRAACRVSYACANPHHYRSCHTGRTCAAQFM